MPRIVLVVFSVFVLLPAMAVAEIVYVIDTLRVGVRAEPDNTMVPAGVVVTGMKLEVLDRADGYIKIRTEQGVEGWIKDIYVTSELPARLQLAKLNEQHTQTVAEADKKDEFIKSLDTRNAALSEELDSLKQTNSELRSELLKNQRSSVTDSAPVRYSLMVLLLIVLVIGAFAAGVYWHRKQTMKRLGGLRL